MYWTRHSVWPSTYIPYLLEGQARQVPRFSAEKGAEEGGVMRIN